MRTRTGAQGPLDLDPTRQEGDQLAVMAEEDDLVPQASRRLWNLEHQNVPKENQRELDCPGLSKIWVA